MTIVFARPLEAVALFWRIERRDGVALGFTGHDRDLWFDGLLHRAAPGMIPSAIRKSAGLDDDSAEVEGVIAHDCISEADLACGRFDDAAILIGVIDWENLDRAVLYSGRLGEVSAADDQFNANLRSAKTLLDSDPVPRTAPLCRAAFCGPGCNLNASRFTVTAVLDGAAAGTELFRFTGIEHARFLHGELTWLDGPLAGTRAGIIDASADGLLLDRFADPLPPRFTRARLREGCDHTLATCAGRFGNAVNFRGEPFLPGNDLIARYPKAS